MSTGVLARALPGDLFEWSLLGAGAPMTSPERGSAEALINACAERELTLLLDGRAVGTAAVAIPAKSERQARTAAPYAIEDEVTEDLEALHVTCGPAEDDGQRTVGYVRKADLDPLLAPLAAARVAVQALRPDYLALPWTPGTWSVLAEEDRLLVRTAPRQGFSVERALAEEVISRKLAEQSPERIIAFGTAELPVGFADLPCTRETAPGGGWSVLATGAIEDPGLDLLPASYPRARSMQRSSWLWAVGLLVLAVVLHLGFLIAGNAQLSTRIAGLRAEQEALMRSAFPDITRIVNAEIQATQAVAALRGASGGQVSALDLLHGFGAATGAGDGRLRLLNLNFADGVMSVQALAPDIASLEAMGNNPESTVQIEILSVETRPDGAVGNLRVSREGASP